MKTPNSKLLTALANCAAACNYCAAACLDETNVELMRECIRLDIDCAEICKLSSSFVSRGSVHTAALLRECAQICSYSAAECSKHDMQHCKLCADACRKCAHACSEEIGAVKH